MVSSPPRACCIKHEGAATGTTEKTEHMISSAPRDCCLRGVKHEGTPTGTLETIENITTYIARPPSAFPTSPKSAILLISDIFGIYPNAQLMADSFAARGYLTVLPDLFAGDALTLASFAANAAQLPAWLEKHAPDSVDPIIATVVKHLRELGVERIGGVGYCYGAKYVVRNLNAAGGLDAGYLAHPSFVTEEEFNGITKPLSIAASEIDTLFTRSQRYAAEARLVARGVPYQINVYGGVEHGFALRADLGVKRNRYAMEDAFRLAVGWFGGWLGE